MYNSPSPSTQYFSDAALNELDEAIAGFQSATITFAAPAENGLILDVRSTLGKKIQARSYQETDGGYVFSSGWDAPRAIITPLAGPFFRVDSFKEVNIAV